MKPVIVIKAGRRPALADEALAYSQGANMADAVFTTALERAGAVRVGDLAELVSVAQLLARDIKVRDDRLAIIANGEGPGALAADRALELGVRVPQPGAVTRRRPAAPAADAPAADAPAADAPAVLRNPINLGGGATPEHYAQTLAACLRDEAFDAVLVMLTPQAMTKARAVAKAVIAAARQNSKPVLACWMGGRQVAAARALLNDHKLPVYSTPEASVAAFAYLARYRRSQQLLMQVPAPLEDRSSPDVAGARAIIERVLAEGRPALTGAEAKAVLEAFHIPVAPSLRVHTAEQALVAAQNLGFPVAMKICAPDLMHTSDVGGVRLNIANSQAVRGVFEQMLRDVAERHPQATVEGVTIEPMYTGPNARELLVGVTRDPVFGPVISLGAGGMAVEALQERGVALPPLNRLIIRGMVERAAVAKLLGPFRHMPPVNREALEEVMLRVSDMVCELPQIRELDIHPLIADERGVLAVDVRMTVAPPAVGADRYAHMAIHPYPTDLVRTVPLEDGTRITLRPIRPEDAKIEAEFVRRLSAESKYFRFMQALQELTPEMLVRFTQIDYHRDMAFIAVTQHPGEEIELGVARYTINPDGESCEFAIVVADDWHHRGIGSLLMQGLLDTAKARGLKRMEGEVLTRNRDMLALVQHFGFTGRQRAEDPAITEVTKAL